MLWKWRLFLAEDARRYLPETEVHGNRKGCPKAPFSYIQFFGTRASAALRDVLRRWTLLSLDDVELHRITFGERLESVSGDRAVMHEAVLLSVVRGDEAKALRIVEPLYLAGRTHSCSW